MIMADSIKQIFHWCFLKKILSGKCLFPMLKVFVYGARGAVT